MFVLAIGLAVRLPPRTPELKSTYPALLASMGTLALNSRILRQRVIYQCFLYGAFSVFWTTIRLRLMGPAFHFSQAGVALFALLGGAVAFWRRRSGAGSPQRMDAAWPPPAR